MPCSLCGPGWPPERIGDASGSTATTFSEALRGLSTSPTPVMVPPVPMPETMMSTLPSVSFQISSAVVLRWIAGLAGLANCWRMRLPGILAASSSAFAMAPFMPFGPSVRMTRAPRILSSLRRSMLIVSGIVRMSLRPLAAATNASAMPVLPLVGSIRTVLLLTLPLLIASSIMEKPMRSFTLESGLKSSSLSTMSARTPCAAAVRLRRTSGVLPMVSVMSLWIFAMSGVGCRLLSRERRAEGSTGGAPAAVEETLPRGKEDFVRQQADDNEDYHDANDLIHGVKFTAIVQQVTQAKSTQNRDVDLRRHQGPPGKRPALFHAAHDEGQRRRQHDAQPGVQPDGPHRPRRAGVDRRHIAHAVVGGDDHRPERAHD